MRSANLDALAGKRYTDFYIIGGLENQCCDPLFIAHIHRCLSRDVGYCFHVSDGYFRSYATLKDSGRCYAEPGACEVGA